jgi:hypothetical protein
MSVRFGRGPFFPSSPYFRLRPGQPRTCVEEVGQQPPPEFMGPAAYPVTGDKELGAAVATATRGRGAERGRHHAVPGVRLSPQLGLPVLHFVGEGVRAYAVLQVDAVVEGEKDVVCLQAGWGDGGL